MDKDVGARLDEGDSVKMSVKADGATAVEFFRIWKCHGVSFQSYDVTYRTGCISII